MLASINAVDSAWRRPNWARRGSSDSSEATVRSSSDRTQERIREIVDAVVRERVEEGQFDECDISLRDLRIVTESFVSTLSAIYHPRVEYPEPSVQELEARGRNNKNSE